MHEPSVRVLRAIAEALSLPPDELLREAGRIVKKEDLSERVLERKLSPYDRSLDMHISNLRKKLGPRSDGSDRIKTIRSVGYIYTVV